MKPSFFFIGLCSLSLASHGADMLAIDVDKTKKIYKVTSSIHINAPKQAVFNVIQNFDELERISSLFVNSATIPTGPNMVRLTTLTRGCVAFFCQSINSTENIRFDPPNKIESQGVPEQSDHHVYAASWQFYSVEKGTRVDYQLEMDPKFWVPPLIGTWAIKRMLKQDGQDAIARIETLALDPEAILDTDG